MAEKNSLWKKAEQNRRTGAKPRKPTTEMLRQERKIKAQKADGGPVGEDELYNIKRAVELGYTPDETGHWPSVDSETGMFLKSKEHPTAFMEYLYGYTLNPELNKNTNVVVNPEGYFGDNQLQYIPKKQYAEGSFVGEEVVLKPRSVYNTETGLTRDFQSSSDGQTWINNDDPTQTIRHQLPEFEVFAEAPTQQEYMNAMQKSNPTEYARRLPATGRADYVPVEMALLPASLPFKATTALGKAGKFAAEVVNPIGGLKGTPKKLPGSSNAALQQMGFFNTKGALQKYPKGKLTQEEIKAFKNSDYYKQSVQEHLEVKNKYGDSWTLPNYAEEALEKAIATGNRSRVNPILYGGRNWGAADYTIAGLAGTAYPGYAGIMGLAFSPPAIKNKVLNAAGITSKPGVLSSRDTTINITNRPMDFAKVNEIADGQVILGGEFIEGTNNTVRKAKDWLTATDTYSDKEYPSKNIQSFYGIENGKFKVGKASDFNPNTEIVPRRFGATNINKAILNEGAMRLLDSQGNPIYQNTPNTGKFILHSPSTKETDFNYMNTGKSGVDKVNKFLKKNKDAQYIHLDNGRYEFYGLNSDGLTNQDFRDYYQQDLEREGNPGYNMILKAEGGYYPTQGPPKALFKGYAEGGYMYPDGGKTRKREVPARDDNTDTFTREVKKGLGIFGQGIEDVGRAIDSAVAPFVPTNTTAKQYYYNNYSPIEYPEITNLPVPILNTMWDLVNPTTSMVTKLNSLSKPNRPIGLDKEGNPNIGEEAWKKALGLPTKEKYIVKSQYKPTDSEDPNAQYYTINPDVVDKQKIIDYVKSDDFMKRSNQGKNLNSRVTNMGTFSDFIKDDFMDKEDYYQIDPIQKFQINKSWDPEKKKWYASIYDKYDFDSESAEKVIKPYEFYDRVYFDSDEKPIELNIQSEKELSRINPIERDATYTNSRIREVKLPKEQSVASKVAQDYGNPFTEKKATGGYLNQYQQYASGSFVNVDGEDDKPKPRYLSPEQLGARQVMQSDATSTNVPNIVRAQRDPIERKAFYKENEKAYQDKVKQEKQRILNETKNSDESWWNQTVSGVEHPNIDSYAQQMAEKKVSWDTQPLDEKAKHYATETAFGVLPEMIPLLNMGRGVKNINNTEPLLNLRNTKINPALGEPLGTAADLKNINSNSKQFRDQAGNIVYELEKVDYHPDDWNTIGQKDFTEYVNSWLNKKTNAGGYTDVPEFNKMAKGLFAKEPQLTKSSFHSNNEIKQYLKKQKLMGDLDLEFEKINPNAAPNDIMATYPHLKKKWDKIMAMPSLKDKFLTPKQEEFIRKNFSNFEHGLDTRSMVGKEHLYNLAKGIPKEPLSIEMKKLLESMGTDVNNPFFQGYVKEGVETGKNLFNTKVPVRFDVGQMNAQGGYVNPYQHYAQGGYTNPYNQYQDDPYLQYKVGGKVWQGIGSAAWGVLSGTLNTVTGGLTTSIMDMGEDALQKAANKNFDPNDPEDVKAMRQIETAGASGEIGGSWLGLTLNPANVGSAVAGTGKGANDIIQASTASDSAKQWSQGISGIMQFGHTMNGMGSASSASGIPGGAANGAGAGTGAGEGVSKFGDVLTNFSGSKFGKGAKQAMPYVNQAAGTLGGNDGSLLQQGVARQEYLNSPEYLRLKEEDNVMINQGINFSQGGNITNNSLNLRNTMRYKRFAQGGSFSQHGINILPKSGALHHQSADGGIPFQGGGALAEGGEIIMDNQDGSKYVVSDRVDGAETQPDFTFSKDGKYKELNRSLADGMNQDLKKYTMAGLATNPKFKNDEKRPYGNRPAKPHTDQIKEKWQLKTEYARQRSQHDKAIAQAEEQKRMAEEQYIAAYGGRINPKKYPGLNMSKKAKGGYVHNQMTQPMYAQGGPIYGDPASEYVYAYGGMYGNPYARGGQIDYTNDMYAGGGPMVSNVNQPFKGPAAQNRGGMYIYPDGGMMPPEQQMMQQAPQEQMQQQGGGQEQMMQMVEQAAQMLEQGAQPEQVMQQLVQAGVPQEQAQQIVQMAMQEAQGQQQQQPQGQPMQEGQQMPPQQGMSTGGRLPKDILRARAEAHMSPEKAANYVNNYANGGRMRYDGGGTFGPITEAEAIASGYQPPFQDEIDYTQIPNFNTPTTLENLAGLKLPTYSTNNLQLPNNQLQDMPVYYNNPVTREDSNWTTYTGTGTGTPKTIYAPENPIQYSTVGENNFNLTDPFASQNTKEINLPNSNSFTQGTIPTDIQNILSNNNSVNNNVNKNTDTPWSKEPWYSRTARYGSAIPGIAATITGVLNKKRKLTPDKMTAQTVSYEPERIVDREESRRALNSGLRTIGGSAANVGMLMGNTRQAVLDTNKALAGRISESVMREKNTNAQLAQQASGANFEAGNQFKQLNEQMFQNAQTQALAGLQDTFGSKLPGVAAEERKQYLQEWIAKNRLKTRNYSTANSGQDLYSNNTDGYLYDSNGNRV